MASPSITSITQTSFTSATTAHNVVMPAVVAAGDLLIAIFIYSSELFTITTPTGWTEIWPEESDGAEATLAGFAKDADGTEDGANVDHVTSGSCGGLAFVLRVLAAEWEGTLAGGLFDAAIVEASTASPNPPSLNPGLGSKDFRFVAIEACYFDRVVTAYPTSYADNQLSVNGGVATNLVHMGLASRALTAASDDPGTFTTDSLELSFAQTLAIAPAAAAGGGTVRLAGGSLAGGALAGGKLAYFRNLSPYVKRPGLWLPSYHSKKVLSVA